MDGISAKGRPPAPLRFHEEAFEKFGKGNFEEAKVKKTYRET